MGNISKNGNIYHPPWSPWYTKTKISTEKGERWFCSEREAIDAGWRARPGADATWEESVGMAEAGFNLQSDKPPLDLPHPEAP